MDYKKNNMSTDREKERGNKRARVTRDDYDGWYPGTKHKHHSIEI
jgi:hypothetical protein